MTCNFECTNGFQFRNFQVWSKEKIDIHMARSWYVVDWSQRDCWYCTSVGIPPIPGSRKIFHWNVRLLFQYFRLINYNMRTNCTSETLLHISILVLLHFRGIFDFRKSLVCFFCSFINIPMMAAHRWQLWFIVSVFAKRLTNFTCITEFIITCFFSFKDGNDSSTTCLATQAPMEVKMKNSRQSQSRGQGISRRQDVANDIGEFVFQ